MSILNDLGGMINISLNYSVTGIPTIVITSVHLLNRFIIWGEPERAPNTRETGSGVAIYIIYVYVVNHRVLECDQQWSSTLQSELATVWIDIVWFKDNSKDSKDSVVEVCMCVTGNIWPESLIHYTELEQIILLW